MSDRGGAPEYLYLVVPLVLLAGCVYLRPCVRGKHTRGEDAYTALLSPSVRTARNAFDRRVAIAVREAKLGFYVCVACGFTNAVRAKACALCGVAAAPLKKGFKALFTDSEMGPQRTTTGTAAAVAPSLVPWDSLTSRQRRVRRRKEWSRHMLSDGSVLWCRDDQCRDEPIRSFPVYVLQSKPIERLDVSGAGRILLDSNDEKIEIQIEIETEPAEDVLGAEAVEILSIEQVSAMLQNEVRVTGLAPVSVSEGDDANVRMAIVSERSTAERDGVDSVAHATLDFPSKLAHFMTTMATLFFDAADHDEDGDEPSNKSRFFIDRENVLADSIKAIATMTPKQSRGAIRVEFTNEQGIDAGGVYREWFLVLNQKLVAPEAGVFVCVDERDQTFYLNPHSRDVLGEHHLAHFLAVGRLLGRALLEGNVTGFHLALPLLKIIMGLPVGFRDLEYFDPELFQNLTWLLENNGVDALGLDFTVTHKLPDGTTRDVELVPGGRAIDVTDDNKRQYVDCKLRHLLFESVSEQLFALLRGVYEVVPVELFLLFDAEELDFLVSGSDKIDVDDWQAHTVATTELVFHPAYELFWKIVRELNDSELRRLLQFATGSTRVPPGGFGALTSHDGRLCLFTLKGVSPATTYGYLHSHACFNTLDVPLHGLVSSMRTAVRAAITGQRIGFTTA